MSVMSTFLNTTATLWIPIVNQDGTNEIDANGQPINSYTRIDCNARVKKKMKKIFRMDGKEYVSLRQYIIDQDPVSINSDVYICDGTVTSALPTTEAFKIVGIDPIEDFDITSEWEVFV